MFSSLPSVLSGSASTVTFIVHGLAPADLPVLIVMVFEGELTYLVGVDGWLCFLMELLDARLSGELRRACDGGGDKAIGSGEELISSPA